MKKIQSLAAALSLLVTVGCGTSLSSDSTTTTTTTSSTAQFSFGSILTKSLASGGGGADSGPIVSVADFNGDGKGDFAVLNRSLGSVSVYLSNGSDFNAEQLYTTVGGAVAINSGDFNGDGRSDLVVISATGTSFLFNDGSGSFLAQLELPVGTANGLVACADFDQDGHQDVAVVESGSAGMHILYSDGGTNPSSYTLVDYTTGTLQNPVAVALGDFDSDGKIDLVLGNGSSNSLVVWYNHGSDRAGQFPSGDSTSTGLSLPTNTSARGVACADFNGDGRLDIACSGASTNTDGFVELYLNTTSGFVVNAGVEASPDQQTLAVGDFNLDGFSDVAAISRVGANSTGNGEVDFFMGDGAGGLYSQLSYQLGARATAVASQDFNADGSPDLVVAGNGSAYVLLNTSTR